MPDSKQQEVIYLSDANNYFAQNQREFNLREAELIRKENALNNRLLETGQSSPAEFIATDIWPAAVPRPVWKPRSINDVGTYNQRFYTGAGTHNSRPSDFSCETF